MESVKSCISPLPEDLIRPIREFAKLWRNSEHCPSIDDETQSHWSQLIENWMNDPHLPIFVRRKGMGFGVKIRHSCGRELVFADNSPAVWAYSLALRGEKPNINQIREWLNQDTIPIAMIKTKEMSSNNGYQCVLSSKKCNLNILGWKLAHIDRIGLGQKGKLADIEIATIKKHFLKFMSPSNMFVVPKVLAGIAEISEVCDEFRPLA
jgi:hypothetical protein